MKFARQCLDRAHDPSREPVLIRSPPRYLEETLVSEWRRAYIDYRGLKELIKAIEEDLIAQKEAQDGNDRPTDRNDSSVERSPTLSSSMRGLSRPRRRTPRSPQEYNPDFLYPGTDTAVITGVGMATSRARAARESRRGTPEAGYRRVNSSPLFDDSATTSPRLTSNERGRRTGAILPEMLPLPSRSTNDLRINSKSVHRDSGLGRMTVGTLSGPHQAESSLLIRNSSLLSTGNSRVTPIGTHTRSRGTALKDGGLTAQTTHALFKVLERMTPLQIRFVEMLDSELAKVQDFYRKKLKEALTRSALIKEQLNELEDHRQVFNAYEGQHVNALASRIAITSLDLRLDSRKDTPNDPMMQRSASSTSRSHAGIGKGPSPQQRLGPEDYRNSKKTLKKAVLEFYRGVECLQNYRILNMTGFRKALKKFEKVTGIRVAQLYYDGRIEPSMLSNPKAIDDMLRGIEKLYASRFEGGDQNKAKSHLRAPFKRLGHHYATFRTGVFLGLSIPPLIAGIYKAAESNSYTGWPPLLQIYLAFFLPVLLALLFSLNVLVWERVRLNYIFIFEWDVRTVADSRKYAELPAFLLMTLAFAFWFSFSELDLKIAPTAWPIAWLVLAILVLVNPLPIFQSHPRRWFLRKAGGILLSGTHPVSFPDFFLGDQFCSMVYTTTSLYFLGCLYKSNFTLLWGQCGIIDWAVPWLLAALPSSLRAAQCVRRYLDSGQKLHLVNGGKYCSSVTYHALYFYWRSQNSPRNHVFAIWVVLASFMSCYNSSWDIFIDWSLFQRGSKYRFLRKELMYSDRIWVYYFAIFTNILVRFGWLLYLPIAGPHRDARIGIIGIAEVFRRFQWNFFRLENEHLGNVDQLRATREVPLPYTMDVEDDSEGGLRSRWFD